MMNPNEFCGGFQYPVAYGGACQTMTTAPAAEFYETRVLPIPQKAYQLETAKPQNTQPRGGWVFDPKTGAHYFVSEPQINTSLPPIVNKLELGRAEILRYQMEKMRAKKQKKLLEIAQKKNRDEKSAQSDEGQDSDSGATTTPTGESDTEKTTKAGDEQIDMHDFHLSRDIRRKGLPNCLREELFRLVKIEKLTIKKASTILGINYSTAKTIIHIYHKEGRIKKKRVSVY